MQRQIVHIDKNKCNGCGLCAKACHENAIAMVDGNATLTRDDYCDGMGDCLPACPTGAITFETREAAPYDAAAVEANKKAKVQPAGGCPGSMMMHLRQDKGPAQDSACASRGSMLANWPIQIKLAPVTAPYYDNARLLIAADCTAYARAAFHDEFMRGKTTLIGCPKLDNVEYSQKLCEIIKNNNLRSVTIVRMEVPCCGGLEAAAKKALQESGKFMEWTVVTIGIQGQILD